MHRCVGARTTPGILEHNRTAWLVRPGDEVELAAWLRHAQEIRSALDMIVPVAAVHTQA